MIIYFYVIELKRTFGKPKGIHIYKKDDNARFQQYFSHLQAGSSPNHRSWERPVLNTNLRKQLPALSLYPSGVRTYAAVTGRDLQAQRARPLDHGGGLV
jgi:hypothetical protein